MFQSDRGDQMETGQRSKSLRSLSTFFSDRSDRSDRSDHMETRLKGLSSIQSDKQAYKSVLLILLVKSSQLPSPCAMNGLDSN